jgi:hypothetical protein
MLFFCWLKISRKRYGIAIDANCSPKKVELGKLGEVYKVPLVWIHVNTRRNLFWRNTNIYYDPDGIVKTAERALGCI